MRIAVLAAGVVLIALALVGGLAGRGGDGTPVARLESANGTPATDAPAAAAAESKAAEPKSSRSPYEVYNPLPRAAGRDLLTPFRFERDPAARAVGERTGSPSPSSLVHASLPPGEQQAGQSTEADGTADVQSGALTRPAPPADQPKATPTGPSASGAPSATAAPPDRAPADAAPADMSRTLPPPAAAPPKTAPAATAAPATPPAPAPSPAATAPAETTAVEKPPVTQPAVANGAAAESAAANAAAENAAAAQAAASASAPAAGSTGPAAPADGETYARLTPPDQPTQAPAASVQPPQDQPTQIQPPPTRPPPAVRAPVSAAPAPPTASPAAQAPPPAAESQAPPIAVTTTSTGTGSETTTGMIPEALAVTASPDVAEAQRLLARLGYNAGPADGYTGPRTTAAVRAFQQANGMWVDGKIDGALLVALEDKVDEKAQQLRPSWRSGATSAPPAASAAQARGGPPPARRSPTAPRASANAGTGGGGSEDTVSSIVSGLQRMIGHEFDSVHSPGELRAFCTAHSDNWVYDEGTGRFLFCAEVNAGIVGDSRQVVRQRP